jgi:hypothetical protein
VRCAVDVSNVHLSPMILPLVALLRRNRHSAGTSLFLLLGISMMILVLNCA